MNPHPDSGVERDVSYRAYCRSCRWVSSPTSEQHALHLLALHRDGEHFDESHKKAS